MQSLHINTVFGNDPLTNKIWIFDFGFVVTSVLSTANKWYTELLGEIFYFLEKYYGILVEKKQLLRRSPSEPHKNVNGQKVWGADRYKV